MSEYFEGQKLPTVEFEVRSMAVITANIATLDFFPALIEADYAKSVGHRTIFMNTMSLLALMDRYVLDWAGRDAQIKSHELAMRKPVYADMTVNIDGTVTAVRPFAGSSLAGAGTEIEVSVTITADGGARTTGKVNFVVP